MTYANMASVPTQTAGTSPVIAADWNTYVRDNFADLKFGHIVCTSSTRPSTSLAEGVMIYETDTDKVLVYDGAAWVEVSDITNGASNVIQRNVQSTTVTDVFTSTSTSYVDVTNLSVSITPTSSSSKVLVFGRLALNNASAEQTMGQVLRGSTVIGGGVAAGSRRSASAYIMGFASASYAMPVVFVHLDSPATTSATTYKWQVTCGTGGTLTVNRGRADDADGAGNARLASTITAIEVPV